MEFHNTVNLRGAELKKADERAMSQTDWIKQFFDTYSHQPLGGSAVKRAYDSAHSKKILITSARRAISNLASGKDAWIIDTGLTVSTDYDGKEKLYQRNVPTDLFGDTVNKKNDEGLQ